MACVVLIPGVVYAYSDRAAKTYEASAIVQPPDSGTASNDSTATGGAPLISQPSSVLVTGYANLGQVTGRAVKSLRQPVGTIGGLSSSVDQDTGWLTLNATATTPRLAAEAVNAYAAALIRYVEVDLRRQIDTQISGVRQTLALTRDRVQRRDLRLELSSLVPIRDATHTSVRVVSKGDPSVVAPNPGRNALLALILALLIAPPLIVLYNRLGRTLRRPAELEEESGFPLLASIPREAFGPGRDGPRSVRAFQRLRDSVIFFDPDRRPDTVAIVSPLDGEGRTTVAVELARALARAGRRVVLVDTDLKASAVASRLGIPAVPGLTDVLQGRADLGAALRHVDDFESELDVLPVGSPTAHPSELLGTNEMSDLLAGLSERCDFVVIDTAPLLASGDALALVAHASGVVVVARLNHTPRDAVRRMMRLATAVGGRVLGAVATGARSGGRNADTALDGARTDRRMPSRPSAHGAEHPLALSLDEQAAFDRRS